MLRLDHYAAQDYAGIVRTDASAGVVERLLSYREPIAGGVFASCADVG